MERTKDTMLLFKGVKRDTNAAGKQRIQLSMRPEQLAVMVEELSKHLKSPRGAKLDLHVTKKTKDGREFDSGIAFVKEIQEFGAQRPTFSSSPTKGYVDAAAIAKAKSSVTKTIE